MSVALLPLLASAIGAGGTSIVVAYGPLLGGRITNPFYAADQGLVSSEVLYINLTGPAGVQENETNFAIQPGRFFTLPVGFVGVVSVNAVTTGHRFSGYVANETANYKPSTGTFPPSGPTGLLKTIESYLYQQYADDENLQAFVDSYNEWTQANVDWFNTVELPVYTKLTGSMLDWVAAGLYGLSRPALPSGFTQSVGALNTWALNTIDLNAFREATATDYYLTNDDVFKRILTWNFYKGDGKTFDIRWLKRRVMRFLTGVDGTAGTTDNTYPVSVTFGVDNQVNINLQTVRRYAVGGAMLNAGIMNNFYLNQLDTVMSTLPTSPMVPVFQAAIAAGVLELPFQYTYVVNVN